VLGNVVQENGRRSPNVFARLVLGKAAMLIRRVGVAWKRSSAQVSTRISSWGGLLTPTFCLGSSGR
jgi:hypothetical protein